MDQNLNIKAKTTQMLEENIKEKFQALGLDKEFLYTIPKAQFIKEKEG